MEPSEITAGRLHLRPWRASDADAVHTACQDPDIQRWTRVPSPYTHADAVDFVGRRAPSGWANGSAATFAVLDSTTAGLLAAVSIHDLREGSASAEVGYWTAVDARGRGIARDAVQALCRWGFAVLGLHRLVVLIHPDNLASQRTALAAGFRHEGVARGGLLMDDRPADAWVGAVLATD